MGAKIAREDHFDARDRFLYSINREFDANGRVLKEIGKGGFLTSITCDEAGNKTSLQEAGSKITSYMNYDLMGRLKSLRQNGEDGLEHRSYYQYSVLSKLEKQVDHFGNAIEFEYNNLGCLIGKKLPEVVDEQGIAYQPYERYEVDSLGRKILEENAAGDIKRYCYNSYNQITQVQHPDSTIEQFTYYNNGALKEHIDPKGIKNFYRYDALGKVLEKITFSEKGEVLAHEKYRYKSDLLEVKETLDTITKYSYDYAGRKIQEKLKGKDVHILTSFEYDASGRLCKTTEYGANHHLSKVKVFDIWDRVKEEYLIDHEGSKSNIISYEYDSSGNKIEVKTAVSADITLCEHTFYDSFNRPYKMIDAEGKITTILYDEHFKNSLSQYVLKKTTITPKGNQIIEIQDALGRVVDVLEKNSYGDVIAHVEFAYDRRGNKAKEINHVYIGQEKIKEIVLSSEYDNMNRLFRQIEAEGSLIPKITSYEYDACGNLAIIHKPQGVDLEFSYDGLKRNTEISSTDHSVHYLLYYNSSSQLIKVDDKVHNTTLIRDYDALGNLTYEKLSNGLEMHYIYDSRGRRKKAVLPDHSIIEYSYDAFHLRKIERKDSHASLVFEQTFDKFDLQGRLLEENALQGRVASTYEMDHLGRIINCINPFEQYEVKEFEIEGKISQLQTTNTSGSQLRKYQYDDLGQLISEKGRFSNSYEYDSVYNRLRKDADNYNVNELCQLESNKSGSYLYDKNGNLKQKSTQKGVVAYEYDAMGRLTKATIEDGSSFTYVYDIFNRKVAETKSSNQSIQTQYFLYDHDKEIGSFNESLKPLIIRILDSSQDSEIGSTLAIEKGDKVYLTLQDFYGSISALIDPMTLKVVESYEYNAFGEEWIYDSQGNAIAKSLIDNPWRYMNKRKEDPLGLIFFGMRYYDPVIGRWLTPDPAGFADGINLYAYVLNDPLALVDLLGLFAEVSFQFPSINFNNAPSYSSFQHCNPQTSFGTNQWGLPQYNSQFENLKSLNFSLPNSSSGPGFNYETFANCLRSMSGIAGLIGASSNYEYSKIYDIAGKEIPDRRIYFVNGMCNTYKDALASAKYVSDLGGGIAIRGIYNGSQGLLGDAGEYMLSSIGIKSKPSALLAMDLISYFISNPNAQTLLICHSQGAMIVHETLNALSKNIRDRCSVIGIAPGRFIEKGSCKFVRHYVAIRDPVPVIGGICRPAAFLLALGTIKYVNSHPNSKIMDHEIMSPTYNPFIRHSLEQFANGGKL